MSEMLNEIIERVFAQFEEYYPAFLNKIGLKDSSYARMVFYKTLLLVLAKEPLPYKRAQDIAIGRLTRMHDEAQADLFDGIDRDLKK